MPLFFVAEAEVFRDRWYWRDRRVAHAVRVWRIVYQPLTSTYRVTTFGGLSQNFATRDRGARRDQPRRRAGRSPSAGQIDDGSRHYVEFGYRLDTSLLPRPMQIGIGGQPDWQLSRHAHAAHQLMQLRRPAPSRAPAGHAEPRAASAVTKAAAGPGSSRRSPPPAPAWCSRSCSSIATNNPALYERHYVWLFWVNVAWRALLVLVIVVAGVRLLWRVSRGKFGSRLLLKLAAIFALVGVVPGVLIYTVSYQFVSRSIESWFDVKVEGALDAGLNLGSGTLDAIVSDLATKTRLAAERLGESAAVGRAAGARAAARAALGAGDLRSSAAPARRCSRPAAATLRPDARARRAAHAAPGAQRSASSARLEGLDEEASAAARRIRRDGPRARGRA